ncbi:GNAT family N-acetyltransferase [Kitasatospora sp. NPDC048365]|uniref:GNAT family N-acetyltransferase n=1 Tax=Kitasatospora sp. NPDC048365 TaxID=3364050 RepID=UPI0037187875
MVDGQDPAYATRLLDVGTWEGFAGLVERHNGVWGGCWCLGFHPEGVRNSTGPAENRAAKRAHVERGTCHQVLVFAEGECVGWCQFGPPAELPNIKNRAAYAKELDRLPDWRIGCVFTATAHRGRGVARAAVGAALAAIGKAGGGTVEAYPEQSEGRPPQRGAYFHTGPEELYAGFGFVRDRRIAKWRWVMRCTVPSA